MPPNEQKKILILGGGFAGISVLQQLQKIFKNNKSVKISLVNEDNFFLFTPMLPEIASGIIHPSDISIPLRTFCKNEKFYQAKVSAIDMRNNLVAITRTFDGKVKILDYDYLVIALGSTTNYFGNKRIEKNSFTMKTIQDAIAIKSHMIHMMEIADQEDDKAIQEKLMTLVVVGGGFAGVETVGELNDFVRESVRHFYRNIPQDRIKMVLVSAAKDGILPELDSDIAKKATESLQKSGIRIVPNTKAVDAGDDYVLLGNGESIPCSTMIWTAGVTIDSVVSGLDCEHSAGKVVADSRLRVPKYENVFVLGDCAAITDTKTGNMYPPTAQHALRESRVVSHNLRASITGRGQDKEFNYESKGMMAVIGKRNGIASVFGYKTSGTIAWVIWKTYYLTMLPTFEKKFRVAIDWTVNLFFKRDITLVGKIKRRTLNDLDIATIDDVLFKDKRQVSRQSS
ncbi:MAG: NAD(P)/FAD-dependent oxidoreductase [Candidatus Nitrosotenuis sp.]|nr:MAG: NAD(P)/FAD-dependent oxidoreductase [Candidatus Nitrosotenuis sp.]